MKRRAVLQASLLFTGMAAAKPFAALAQDRAQPAARPPQGTDSPTALLAALAVGTIGTTLTEPTRRMGRNLLLDTIGCAVAGVETTAGSIMARHVDGDRALRSATLASGRKVALMSAAMANCTMANALDYDAYGPTGHMAAVVIPVALATAEAFDANGETMLQGICRGIEVGGRIGGALRAATQSADPLTGHTFAVMGAVAAAGHIIGLSHEAMRNGFGIAAYSAQLPTLRRFFSKPQDAMTKYDHLGLAARNGIDAALLAHEGFTGDRTILEGSQPFWRLSGAEGCDWNYLTGGLGETWVTDETRPKAYPVGVGTVTLLDALEGLIASHQIARAEVECVVIRTTQAFVHKNLDVTTEIEAWTDLRYCVSAMLAGISPYRNWYRPDIIRRDDIKAFMQRVEVVQLPPVRADGTRRGIWAAEVEIVTARGTWRDGRDALAPMTDAAVDRKFRDNVSGVLAPAAADRLIALSREVETVRTVRQFGAILQRRRPAG